MVRSSTRTSTTANMAQQQQQHVPLDLSSLPKYSGALGEDFKLWTAQLYAWFRAHNISVKDDDDDDIKIQSKPNDILLLALEKDSIAQQYLVARPLEYRSTLEQSLECLQEYFASPARMEMRRQTAVNALYTRAFRDDTHRGETVQDLIQDFEKLVLQARLNDAECMQMFSWMFRRYTAASNMLKRALTLEVAFIEALRWERVLISKTMASSSSPASSSAVNHNT